MLAGRRAATHWSFCEDLAKRFPKVQVEADPIFVRDGPIWTSAGVTSGIDLALALPGVARRAGVRLLEVRPLDDSLESAFRELVR